MQSCEIKVVQRGDMSALRQLEVKPTVCVLAFQNPASLPELDLLAQAALAIGTQHFILYGPHADALEDEIDFFVEQGREEWLNVVTTAHGGDSEHEVANFAMYAAFPGGERFRCLVVVDERLPSARALVRELEAESSGSQEPVDC